jgi:RNA polymerase sigma-70 factor (ECF subfamily)
MSSPAEMFAPERYRGFLTILARAHWDDALVGWGDPSDLVQQTLLEAHQKREQFTGTTAAAFAAWLKAMLVHNMADAIRARHAGKRDDGRVRSLEAEIDASSARLGAILASRDPSPSSQMAAVEQVTALADALTQLPADQFEAVMLHHLRGLPLKAVAAGMNRSKESVAGLLRRGLVRLRVLMGNQG